MKNSILALFCFLCIASQAQLSPTIRQSFKTPNGIIICYADQRSMNTSVPEPAFLRGRTGGRLQSTATFEVTYIGFSAEAREAFQKAVDIWSALITSNVPIKINATWDRLGRGILGSCRPATFEQNFQGAQRSNVWYPVALANKMANKDLKENESDIEAIFNSAVAWHFDPNTRPPTNSGKYDLVTVVLHEIGHGLGIFNAYEVASNGNGQVRYFFGNSPCVYDLYLQTGSNSIVGYPSPSAALGRALAGNSLFFDSPSVLRLNTVKGKVYAPTSYSQGSSIAHNDEQSYPMGNPNSLMTPSIGAAESIHDPGPITLGALNDMGWTNPILTHRPLRDIENATADFEVICKLVSGHTDYPIASAPTLNYIVNTVEASVLMTPTGNVGEYRATISKPTASQTGTVNYAYCFSLNDLQNRSFSWPGKIVRVGSTSSAQTYYRFKVEPDTQGPRVYHTPITMVRNGAAFIRLAAHFNDTYGVGGGVVEWKVNERQQPNVNFIFVSDSTYRAALPLTGLTLSRGDVISYRITATDHAAVRSNATSLPSASKYYTASVVVYEAAQESYFNTFDDLKADHFWGDFTVSKADFNNGAIQSPHPYPAAKSQRKDFLNFTYDFLIPIKVKAGMGSVKFDEVVLVEPAAEGAIFGSQNFYDYVVVEGSVDKGDTWKPLADGWDASDKTDWVEAWTRDVQRGHAPEVVDKSSLYHSRSISLLNVFHPEDEVILRFRLYSGPTTGGWGWAIDNLEIQIPDFALLHNHVDYVMEDAQEVELPIRIIAANTLKALAIDYSINDGQKETKNYTIVKDADKYSLKLNISQARISKGGYINYCIKATKATGLIYSLPAIGYFRMDVLDFKKPQTTYDQRIGNEKCFVGNFIREIRHEIPATIETEHPYAVGFGLRYESSFSAILSAPIRIDGQDAAFIFDEELALGHGDSATVEGTKDGVVWETLIDKYTTRSFSHKGSFLTGNKFKDGDVVLLRFRLLSDKAATDRGWKISNLVIQSKPKSVFTALPAEQEFLLFPNPARQGEITLLAGETKNDFSAQVSDMYGRQMMTQTFIGGSKEIKLPIHHLPNGIYFVVLIEGEKRRILRFVKM